MSTGRAWTEDEIIALGVRCSVADAASILGIGKHKGYRLLRAGEFPLPTYEIGGRTWVPTRPIRELLGIEPSDHNPNGAQGAGRTRLEPEPSGDEDDGNNQGTRRFRAV